MNINHPPAIESSPITSTIATPAAPPSESRRRLALNMVLVLVMGVLLSLCSLSLPSASAQQVKMTSGSALVTSAASVSLALTTSSTATTATVNWTLNAGDVKVDGVRVGRDGYSTGGTGAWESATLPTTPASKTMTNLRPGTSYILHVTPLVGGVPGTPATATVRTLAAAAPVAAPSPGRLVVSGSTTANSATVNWTLDQGGYNVAGVLVGRNGSSATGGGAWESALLPVSPATKTMKNLLPGTSYTLYVTPVVNGVSGTRVSVTVKTSLAPTATPTSKVLLGHWDESLLRLGAPGLSNYQANKGVNVAMAAAGGGQSHIMKAYDSVWRTSYASSQVARSAEFGHAFAITMPAPGGGGNTGYQAVLNGSQNANIDAFFKSIPVTETAYVILQNEADNTNALGTNASLYSQALGYVINRAAPIYAARGLKGAVGPVFMGYNFSHAAAGPEAYFQTWNFIKYVDASAKKYAFYGLDIYSKYTSADASTYESIPAIAELAFSRARNLGVTRFGIPEFANSLEWRNHSGQIVGTRATQEAWVKTEMPKIKAIAGLEFAQYFHKPTGPESKNAQLLDLNGAQPFTAFAKMF